LGCEDVMDSGVVSLDGGPKTMLWVSQFHKVLSMGTASLAPINIPAISASEAKA